MSEIQQARDVLAKWRETVVPGPWDFIPGIIGTATPLINGTAGNPELLDAIDGFLEFEAKSESIFGMMPNRFATGLAAAIIAADERMSA